MNTNLVKPLTTALMFALLATAALHAQITPTQDAYTNTATPTTNYGSKTTLGVESSLTTYIQFNLSSIPSGYTGADIGKATLKLYVNSVTTAGSFNVDYVNGTWSESTLDANNAPALGTTIAASVPLTTTDKNQYILVDVTTAVQAWLNGTANDGIALVGNSPVNATFDSKENTTTSHPAELDLVFAPGAGGGTITGVLTGSASGLTGGGSSGTLNLSLLTSCASKQVLQWSGSAWACSNAGTGTITGVTAGTALTGGGSGGSVTLNVDTTKVPLLSAGNAFGANNSFLGAVGIGTIAPTHMLEVNVPGATVAKAAVVSSGSDAAFSLINTGSAGREYWIDSGSGNAGIGAGNFGIWDATAGAVRLAVNSGGNVGVGTTTPYTKLHLRQDNPAALGPSITLMNGGGGAGSGGSVDFDGYDTTTNSPTARIQSLDDGNSSSNLTFQTKTPGAVTNGLVEQVRISDYGSLIVDSSGNNALQFGSGSASGTALIFGGVSSGEGVASCRTSAGACTDSNNRSHLDGLDFYTGYTRRMTIDNSGNVFDWGNMYVSGCTYWYSNGNQQGNCLSDARLKTNIQAFPRLLEKLAQLEPVNFDWNPANPRELHLFGGRQTGLIAQQVEKIFPEMVTVGEDGYRRVNYGLLPYLLLEGVRELKANNDSLRAEAESLGKKNEQARAEIAQLRRATTATDTRVAKLGRSSTAKDAQIALMRSEIEQLHNAQQKMMVMLARFAPPQDEHGKSETAAAHPVSKSSARKNAEIATRF